MSQQGLSLALIAFGLLLFGAFGALVALGPALKRQLGLGRRLTGLARHRPVGAARNAREARLARTGVPAGSLDHFLGRLMPRRQMLMLRIERTGRSITISQYLAIMLAIFT